MKRTGGAMWARMPLWHFGRYPFEEWPTELPPYLGNPGIVCPFIHFAYKIERASPAP